MDATGATEGKTQAEQPPRFVDIDDYTSRVTKDLLVVGTEDKAKFRSEYLDNAELRANYKLVGTHSDCFHCDEVTATALLQYTAEFGKSIIVRTRD